MMFKRYEYTCEMLGAAYAKALADKDERRGEWIRGKLDGVITVLRLQRCNDELLNRLYKRYRKGYDDYFARRGYYQDPRLVAI